MAPTAHAADLVTHDPEVVELFATLPVQDGGRVKPLSTYAAFELLGMNGRRSCTTPEDVKLSPTEWLLDTLFFPEIAGHYRCFLVPASEVLDNIGVAHQGRKKRDRYSYAELAPGREKLYELAGQYMSVDAKQRTPLQNQIVNLAQNLHTFEQIMAYFDFARIEYSIDASAGLKTLFPNPDDARYTTILRKAAVLSQLLQGIHGGEIGLSDEATNVETDNLQRLLGELDAAAQRSGLLALFPPAPEMSNQDEWLAPGDLIEVAFFSREPIGSVLDAVARVETLALQAGDPAAFKTTLAQVHGDLTQLASARGEYDKVETEVAFYNWQFFHRALMAYVLGFVIVGLLWLRPQNRWLYAGALAVLIAATLLAATGITFRCIIRGRPPVTTLYETILFITASAVAVALVVEFMNRQKIALSVASILGVVGMFLANRYEIMEGVDTMPSLVAVLDSNFWLSTHVVTVTLGYAAGFLASGIAHVYILGNLLGLRRGDLRFYSTITRMTYGVLAFALLFSVVGTVLGGIWANESWGRFWGWDPKENGALMIVLWLLALLHARLGGYIRDLGINVGAIICGMIVAFSWFHVNLLGVGLHSYGFTSGVLKALVVFYAFQTLMVFLGVPVWTGKRAEAEARAATASAK